MENSYIVPETTLIEIADAIREKTGSTDTIVIEDFAESIKSIEGNSKAVFNYFTLDCRQDQEFIYYVEGMTWQDFETSILNDNAYISWPGNIPPGIYCLDNEVKCISGGGMRCIICNVQSTDKILPQQYECEFDFDTGGPTPF